MSEAVRRYYDEFDEWGRLESPAGRLEFSRTIGYVVDRISARSSVLDIGGGPGRYTIALAELGHEVWLVDPSEVLVRSASSRVEAAGLQSQVREVSVGDVRDLSRFGDGQFDAALALGPFYHLVEPVDRRTAAAELFRTLRPGGEAFVSVIPRLSGLAGLVRRAASDPEQAPPSAIARAASEGVFLNPTDRGFQDGYYPDLTEAVGLFRAAGFDVRDRFSIRGLAFGAEVDVLAASTASGPVPNHIETLIEATCRDENVVNLCGHALLRVRKPGSDGS